jgi:hypothetical protein
MKINNGGIIIESVNNGINGMAKINENNVMAMAISNEIMA